MCFSVYPRNNQFTMSRGEAGVNASHKTAGVAETMRLAAVLPLLPGAVALLPGCAGIAKDVGRNVDPGTITT